MNKIYKVIWSKVRCCYVVVSELAKANGKSAAVRAVKAAPLAALVAAAVVTGSCYMPQPVLASEEIGNTDIVVEGNKNGNINIGQSGTGEDNTNRENTLYIPKDADGNDMNVAINDIIIGRRNFSGSTQTFTIDGKTVYAEYNMAVGDANHMNGTRGLALGMGNTVGQIESNGFSANGLAIGWLNEVTGDHTIAIGNRNKTNGSTDSIVIGYGSVAGGADEGNKNLIALGFDAEVMGDSSVAIGYKAVADSTNSIAFGSNANSQTGATALGYKTNAQKGGIAIGAYDENNPDSVTRVEAQYGIAIGLGATSIGGQDAISMGRESNANGTGSLALGYKSSLNGDDFKYGVALGAYSTGDGYHHIGDEGYKPGSNQWDPYADYYAGTYKDGVWKSSYGAVYVGGFDESGNPATRQISGVAAGKYATDAVNVAQLRALEKQMDSAGKLAHDYSLVENTADGSEGKYTVNDNGEVTLQVKDSVTGDIKNVTIDGIGTGAGGSSSWNLTANGDTNNKSTIGNGNTVDFAGAEKTVGNEQKSNIVVTKETAADGTTKVAFDLADDLNLDNVTTNKITSNTVNATTVNATNQYVTNVDAANNNSVVNIEYINNQGYSTTDYRLVNGTEKISDTVTGYKVKDDGTVELTVQNGDDVNSKQTVTIGDVASKSALDELGDLAVKYDDNTKTTITLNKDGSDVTITNVKDGVLNENSKDAINGSQLYQTNQNVTNIKNTVDAGWTAQVNSVDAKNIKPTDNKLNFINGDNIAITNDNGAVKISTAQEVAFNKVTVGGVVISNDKGIDAGGKIITNAGTSSNTSGNDVVNIEYLNKKLESIGGSSTTDYRLVNGTEKISDTVTGYKVKDDGTVELTVQNSNDVNSKQTVTIGDVASKVKQDINAANISTNKTNITNIKTELGKGLSFAGDSGTTINKKLGETLNVSGGITDGAKLSDNNIGVVAGNNGLSIKLSKEITGLTSVTTNNAYVTNVTNDNTAVTNKEYVDNSISQAITKFDGKHTTVSVNGGKEGNLTVTKIDATDTDGTNYDIKLNDKITLGSETGKQILLDGTAGNIVAGGVTIGQQAGGGANTGKGNYITGLNNKAWNTANIASGRAATEDQLKVVADSIGDVAETANGKITFAGNTGSTQKGLKDTVTIKGEGGKADSEYSGENVKTIVDNAGNLIVKLDKNSTFDSVTTGNTVMNNNGITIKTGSGDTAHTQIIINQGNVSMGGNIIHNVAAGENDTDAVNKGQMDQAIADAKNEMAGNDQHLVAESSGAYKANDKGEVTLKVEGKDANGNKISTDVVIKDVASKEKLDDLSKKVGDGEYIKDNNGQGNVVNNNMTVTEAIGALDNKITNAAGEAGKHSSVTSGNDNISVSTSANKDGGTNYEVTLKKDLTGLDSVQVNNSVTIGSGDNKTTITGDKMSFGEGDKTVSVGKDGISAGGNKVTNVADGEVSADSKDAVNGSQLHAVDQKVDNINQSIDNVNSRVNKLDGRINKVGAGAAALAALHPLDFDPDNKLTFSAGMGNYRGENAAALGMFYRPDEKMMLSLGGTVGNGENMVNMGVSFALDRTSPVTNSKVAMAREIVELREQVAQLTLLVNQLAASQGADSVAAPAAYNRVRVDRISGDDNAANKIERVRVNTGDDKDSYGSKITPVSTAK